MNYSWKKNDYNSETQVNLSNFNTLYPLIYFDLSYQAEELTRDPKELIFRYKLTADSTDTFRVHAIGLYEEEVVVDQIGNQLVFV